MNPFQHVCRKNLADAAACGNIFASPDPNTIMQTALSVNKEKESFLFMVTMPVIT